MTFTELDREVHKALPDRSSCCCTVNSWHHGHSGEHELSFNVTAFAPDVNDRCHQTGECDSAASALARFRELVLPAVEREVQVAALEAVDV